jgi:hypothetical protein
MIKQGVCIICGARFIVGKKGLLFAYNPDGNKGKCIECSDEAFEGCMPTAEETAEDIEN